MRWNSIRRMRIRSILRVFASRIRSNSAGDCDFTQALKDDPRHASAEFALARALQRSGHPDEAKEHFASGFSI
jgi:Tfp pilus assembly protein PilF